MKKNKWSLKEQANLLRQIGELLSRGYPIADAITSISLHLPVFRKKELDNCLTEMKKGESFHAVLESLGFDKELIGYVYFAEQHGNFTEALLEGSSLTLLKSHDMQKLLKLLQYPVILLFITGFLFVFVEHTLLPRFTQLFHSLGLEENFFSKVIYTLDHYFPAVWGALLVSASLAAIYYFFQFRKLPILKQRTLLVRIPLVGRILKLMFNHYFSIQLSFLLSGGISISEALLLFEQNHRQLFYSQLGKEIKLKLISGEKLEWILGSFSFFEAEFAMVVKHGQENGRLEQELLFFSRRCVKNLEELMDKIFKTIQPLFYLFIGFLIVSMYLAILLPMFHLLDGI
ncbi:type II secretion system F family protein [Bacillus sp. BRMEA1]|uniref:competence type IV pilus assembly protein ComGB n=1 Tax=Neobacillus endophyticus TaxID=2738405 RepID=UPI001565AB41|nr:competence type IV pilus assembly protein ComGB [Neobacillus endophyticus]NRD80740.1 type II secretion system F family protein [Neobacillus endophyticus]